MKLTDATTIVIDGSTCSWRDFVHTNSAPDVLTTCREIAEIQEDLEATGRSTFNDFEIHIAADPRNFSNQESQG